MSESTDLTPEEQFLERYLAKKAEADAVRLESGQPPGLDPKDRLPKTRCLSYLHQDFDPAKPGKICIVCEVQKSTTHFDRSRYHEDSHTEICRACTVKFNDWSKKNEPTKARRRRERQQAKKEARNMAKEQRRAERDRAAGRVQDTRTTAAVRELAQRKLAREHLLPFIQRFNSKYTAGWVHKAICKRLEQFSQDVADQKSPRLMIFMPPRGGKSEIASKTFPAWHLGHYPDHEIIASSYAVSLPIGFSRKIKDIVDSPSYKQVFDGTVLSKTAQAAEAWLTTKGGGYVAAGVGTGITGKGAHIAIVDDPVKDAEEADSETQRQKVWDWYSSTLYTRLAPGGGVLVIQTRWHDDDLSGRLIRQQKELEQELSEEMDRVREELTEATRSTVREALRVELDKLEQEYADREQWDVLIFPQVATHDEYYHPVGDRFGVDPDHGWVKIRGKGEPLHPARFNQRMITRMKQTMEPRHWSALHQQNPVPEEGDIFTKSMFRYEPTVPDWRRWDVYIAGDLALGKKQHNDWSVLLVGAMDYEGQLHIIEMSRFKGGAVPIVENLIALLKRYEKRLVRFGLEEGQIQMALWPEILRRIKKEKLSVSFAEGKNALKPVSDKLARSRVAQAMMQQGRIIWPENQPWVEDARSELLRFPGGIFDDVVDAAAWLARMTVKVQPPKPPRRKKIKSWKQRVNEIAREQAPGYGGHMGA